MRNVVPAAAGRRGEDVQPAIRRGRIIAPPSIHDAIARQRAHRPLRPIVEATAQYMHDHCHGAGSFMALPQGERDALKRDLAAFLHEVGGFACRS